jgi:cyclic pyranopterin phosphate synthase
MKTVHPHGNDNRTLDAFSRPLEDLRISVIDRCNLRCTYCMPAEVFDAKHPYLPRSALLTYDEITRLASLFVSLGVQKIRLTGGEPLLRRNLTELISNLSQIPGLNDLALTTNGLLLPQLAKPLKKAGLNRLTVSLDTLQNDRFRSISDRDFTCEEVFEGIHAAEEAGFTSVKINMMVQRGVNDDEIVPMLERFADTPHVVRFIEFMDVGNTNNWRPNAVVSSQEMRERIGKKFPIHSVKRTKSSDVAQPYALESKAGKFGFISSITEPFCGECSRGRLSSIGELYTCLFASDGVDLRGPLRDGCDDDTLRTLLSKTWTQRKDRYSEERRRADKKERNADRIEMSYIGG